MSDGRPFDLLLQNNGAVVAEILLEELKVKVGDKLRIGEGEFTIRGTFDEEPGGTSGFRLGGRIFIEKKAFDSAGITRNTAAFAAAYCTERRMTRHPWSKSFATRSKALS